MSNDLVRRYWPDLCSPRHYGPSVAVSRSPICRYNPPSEDMRSAACGRPGSVPVNSIARLCAGGWMRRQARATPAFTPASRQRRIFVAFDARGRHYAYAVHWDTMPPQLQGEQRREVMAMIRANREAYSGSGVIRLLEGSAFSWLVQTSGPTPV